MRSQHFTGRGLAILLGGVAGSILGARVLPPLFAAISGRARARAGADPFELLMEDHRRIASLLDQMIAAPTGSRLRRGRLFLALKRKLAKHAMAEEDVVYPTLRGDAGQRKHLYDEHADMKILLYNLEQQLRNGDGWTSAVAPLRDLIRSHIAEEERTVFPELRRKLSGEKRPKVAGQISREEALVV